jgi:CheY-like chemotaxis protein
VSHPPHTVLVVEDELALREILHDALAGEGHHVEVAADGNEGLDRLRDDPKPCVVLLDMLMPRMNGWQMAATMRSTPGLAEIPLVVITANPRYAADAAAMQARWLGKPLDLDLLFATVNEVCTMPGDARRAAAGD